MNDKQNKEFKEMLATISKRMALIDNEASNYNGDIPEHIVEVIDSLATVVGASTHAGISLFKTLPLVMVIGAQLYRSGYVAGTEDEKARATPIP